MPEEAIDSLQGVFLQQITDRLPPDVSLVNELADLLHVSNDSAYRRIRGETSLTFEEIFELSQKYQISLDALSGGSSNAITFRYKTLNAETLNMEQYLDSILQDLKMINSFDEKQIIYAAKDIPVFHLFQVPEIAAFKTFMWMKTIASFEGMDDMKFDPAKMDPKILDLGKQIIDEYMSIPTIEIWNEETITSILQQIIYYNEAGLFAEKGTASLMCDKLSELVEHLQLEASHGFKFHLGRKPVGKEDSFQMYINEIVLPENTIQVSMGDNRAVYITHNIMNYLVTTNPNFCETTRSTQDNLIKRSILVSGVSEKERNKFIIGVNNKIQATRERL